jgi:AcrR family transcriptional regulator
VSDEKTRQRVPQAVRSAKMQQRLSEAAYLIIRDGGYVNFRTSAVAKRAGVSQGAQLHHYPTKDSLAIAALDYAYKEYNKLFEANYAAVDQCDDLLDLIFKDFKDFYLSDYFSVALDILISGGKNEELREKLVAITRENRRLVERAWLEELINDGWPLALAEELLALSHSIIRGFAARALVIDDPAHFDRLLTRWRSMVDTLANGKNTVIQNIKKEASR